jgi:antitoxin HicB
MKPIEYLKMPYSRVIIPDEIGGFSAHILEFPGCLAEGETVEETYRSLERAAESWITVALDDGQDIPLPNQQWFRGKALRD